ncbi:MAG: Bug family tripartite tricarboxylate transporter substrate binding protein [Xanthobacteraceae bacterium]
MKRVCLVLAAVLLACAGTAMAQDKYPSKPVKILVPYAPGGATDIITRVVSEQLRQSLGQPFVVENKAGAFGILALEEMAKSRADGYTLMVGNVSTNAITPVLFKEKLKIDYDKDVVSVTRMATLPSFFIATAKDFAPKTLAEFVDYAKKNPGKVRYTSAGVGSFPHFDTEIFAKRAGIDMVHIPIKAGASGMLNDLVNGDVQVAFINVATTGAMVKAGSLKPLAVVSEHRLAEYPDVPTMAEAGYPGVGTLHWQSMLAPAATPKDVIDTLHKAVGEALQTSQVQEAFKKQLIEATPSKSPEEAKAWLANEIATWKKITGEIKIEMN